MMGTVPRIDAYSTGDYGDTVRVFRLKAGGPFYAVVNEQQRLIRQPGGKRIWNVRDARQWARDTQQGMRAGVGSDTLATLFDSYLTHRSPVKATAQGRKDDKRRAEMWKQFLGASRDPLTITRSDLESFVQKRGHKVINAYGKGVVLPGRILSAAHDTGGRTSVKVPDSGSVNTGQTRTVASGRVRPLSTVRPRTVHADLQWLRTVLRWSLQDQCPVPPVKLSDIARDLHQTAEPRRPVATEDRYERILQHLDSCESGLTYGYLRELLVLVNGTGHRLSEILSLRFGDIGLDDGLGSIRWRSESVGNKARLERTVPIAPQVRRVVETILRERPGIGDAWLFPGLRNSKQPTHRSVADAWLRAAEKAAKLPPLPGSLWHAYRRKWATERKHLPGADVAYAGGWKNERTLQSVYQAADAAGVLRVVLDSTELREEKA